MAASSERPACDPRDLRSYLRDYFGLGEEEVQALLARHPVAEVLDAIRLVKRTGPGKDAGVALRRAMRGRKDGG